MKLRKLGGIVLAAAVAVGAISIPAFAASSTTDDWDGTADTSWYVSDDTEFELDSAEDLAGLASLVAAGTNFTGKTVNLTVNVKLNTTAATGVDATQKEWTPIGGAAASNSFKGTFNGNGNTIYNIYYNHVDGTYSKGDSVKNNIGLFGKLEEGATVKNVTVNGGYVAAQRSVGAIVGKSWGNIENCHNVGVKVYSTDSKGLGGIVGASWINKDGRSTVPVISGCSNSGTVICTYSKGSAGGIVGENEGEIYDSSNAGSVTSPYNAGGIAGYNDEQGYLENCTNTGTITGSNAGQLIGYDALA